MPRHQASIVEAEAEEGIATVTKWVEKELGMVLQNNPDAVILRHGLFSVADARRVADLASQVAFSGEHRVLIITASRAYHEAQNALLKLFEEPPTGTYLFFIIPSFGGLLPTLRSRVQELKAESSKQKAVSGDAEQFLKATKEKRSALIKKLADGKDEGERRENRETALHIVNGVEALAYQSLHKREGRALQELLSDIAVLRGHLYERSAPVRMILEHLSLVIPKEVR